MKEPPYSPEAERSVLGSILLQPKLMGELVGELTEDDFFLPAHRAIWRSMVTIQQRRSTPDVIAVLDDLRASGDQLKLEGGENYVMEVAASVPISDNYGHYVGMVRNKTALRGLQRLCGETLARIDVSSDSGEILEDTAKSLTALQLRSTTDIGTMAGEMPGLLQAIEERVRVREVGGGSKISGILTGVTRMDEMLGGLQPDRLYAIAGRPGGGKSSLALQAALSACFACGSALFINLEMNRRETAERALCQKAQVNSHLLQSGQIDYKQFRDLHGWGGKLSDLRCYVVDDAFRPGEITSLARRWRSRHPDIPGVVVIDYLQLIHVSTERGENSSKALGKVAQSLKELAKSLHVPVVALSQLAREGARQNDRPTIFHLRESGDIEAACDAIILIHNPDSTQDGDVELIVGKNRHGPSGTLRSNFVGRYYTFGDPISEVA